MNMERIRQIEEDQRKNPSLSKYACPDSASYRKKPDKPPDFRSDFARDRDRILYSGAYRRYYGKTQVFSFSSFFDEELTNRSIHTTYVSQVARTVGKNLRLNLDLVEAIALGHDLGHTPFGHDGEKALSDICVKHGIGCFHHNIESLHIVDNISRQGDGLNLTFQVRDGIISHDGEIHEGKICPQRDKTEDDITAYISDKKNGNSPNMMPATLEGCVVRICDTIAYIGQDIEDAIRYEIIKREDIPIDCRVHLGSTNSEIINNLVISVVINSYDHDYVRFDPETAEYLKILKDFNYDKIYGPTNDKKVLKNIAMCMEILFDKYMQDIQNEDHTSKIFLHFLNQKNYDYLKNYSDAEKVRDFLATMTDRYFNEEIKDYLILWK